MTGGSPTLPYAACALPYHRPGHPFPQLAGLVTPDPDVRLVDLAHGRHEFVIAASDGVWGCVDDQAAVDCVAAVVAEHARGSAQHRAAAAKMAARQLLRLALDEGSRDDVTVVVSIFEW